MRASPVQLCVCVSPSYDDFRWNTTEPQILAFDLPTGPGCVSSRISDFRHFPHLPASHFPATTMKRWIPWLLVPLAAWAGFLRDRPAAASQGPRGTRIAAESPSSAAVTEFGNMTVRDLETRLAEELGKPLDQGKLSRLRLICARWAELDPAGGLAWIGSRKPDMANLLRDWLLTEWALLDSSAAWAAIPPGAEGDQDRALVTGELLHEDKELFMQWFRRVRQPVPAISPAWLAIAERYPEEFEKIALDILARPSVPGGDSRDQAAPFYAVLARLRAEKDPSAALEWALALDPLVRSAAAVEALKEWAKSDPTAAWKMLVSMDEKQFREVSYDETGTPLGTRMLRKIAEEDPATAMKLILETKGHGGLFNLGGIDAMTGVLASALNQGTMTGVDAYRLLTTAKGSDSHNLGLNVLTKMWSGLPEDRLAEAAKGILAEPAAHLQPTALAGIVGAWMVSNFEAANSFIAGIPDANLRRQILGKCLVNAYGGNVDPSTQAGILRAAAPEDRAGAFNAFLDSYGWSYSNPEGEGTLGFSEHRPEFIAPLFADLPPSADLNRAIRVTAKKWGELDPASAIGWAEQLTDPKAKRTAWSSAIEGWAHHDPYAAAECLARTPAGPVRDASILPLVRKLGESDPAGAWDWAGAVGDPALQAQARVTAFKGWEKQSPDEARVACQAYLATLQPAAAAEFHKLLSGK